MKISNYSWVNNFKPNEYLTREQLAKLFLLVKDKFILEINDYKSTFSNYSSGNINFSWLKVWVVNTWISNCNFKDISKSSTALRTYLLKSCNQWIIKWNKWYILPNTLVSKWQNITILMRIVFGNQDENNVSNYAENYVRIANAFNTSDNRNPLMNMSRWPSLLLNMWYENKINREKSITRWEVAIMIYRLFWYSYDVFENFLLWNN